MGAVVVAVAVHTVFPTGVSRNAILTNQCERLKRSGLMRPKLKQDKHENHSLSSARSRALPLVSFTLSSCEAPGREENKLVE